jgi:hypothetical protein
VKAHALLREASAELLLRIAIHFTTNDLPSDHRLSSKALRRRAFFGLALTQSGNLS